MKKKIVGCVLIILILIASIIVTATVGIRVNLNYGEGVNILFSTEEKDLDMDKVNTIAKDIFGKNNYVIKKVEFFNNTALIKVRSVNDDQIQSLCDKINSEMGTELKTSDVAREHATNIKVSSVIEPYIIPIGLSLLLIVAWYAIRFKGAKQMASLIRNVFVWFLLYYAVYALGRVQFNGLTMPILMGLYLLVVIFSTYRYEKELETEKASK